MILKNRWVFSSCRNQTVDEAARTRCGREFQARAAATGKARSPIVVRHVDGTSRETDSVERSCRPEERLDVGRIHSLRYTVARCHWDSGTSAHTAGTGSANGLLANVAPEAVGSCEQICSPRRPPALPQNLARAENGSVRLQLHQPTQNCSSLVYWTSVRGRVIRDGRVREWRTEFIWRIL